jgi:DNA repair protein RadC
MSRVVKYKNQAVFVSGSEQENAIIKKALEILESRMGLPGAALGNPDDTRNFLTLKLRTLEHELFSIIFLDNRHRVIEYKEMFRGTVNGASVHPREVVKEALSLNAAAVILAHNHPSGVAEPSEADKSLTRKLSEALALVDVRVLDHFVIGEGYVSFAERGWI